MWKIDMKINSSLVIWSSFKDSDVFFVSWYQVAVYYEPCVTQRLLYCLPGQKTGIEMLSYYNTIWWYVMSKRESKVNFFNFNLFIYLSFNQK